MKSSWLEVAGVLSISLRTAAFTGCGAEGMNDSSDDLNGDESAAVDENGMELGTVEQGLMSCTNPDGTNAADQGVQQGRLEPHDVPLPVRIAQYG